MLRRMTKSGGFVALLCISLLIPQLSYGQFSEIEFIDFEMSDTVTIGGTLTVTGVLKNNGEIPIPAELALRMATGTVDDPPIPYSNNYIENNFNNSIIYPGELQAFVRLIEVTEEWFDIANGNLEYNENSPALKSSAAGGRVIAIIWPRGDESELQDQENTPQYKSDFDGIDTYIDSIVVLQPDEALVQESYDANPGILKGIDLQGTPIEDAATEDIVGFRHDGIEWIQIPIQIDEMKWVDPYLLYNGNPVGYNPGELIKVYADAGTYTGADDIATFDADDELVFMLKDAGSPINLENNTLPIGTISGTGVEISIQNNLTQNDTYIYLFTQDGSLQQDANDSYISYDFSLLTGDYFSTYNSNYSNPENTSVVGDNYALNFSDTWVTEDMHIEEGESSGIDILNAYDTYMSQIPLINYDFSFRCFVTNKEGPIRGIRSYMRGDFDEPVKIQKTHFFYANRHDVFTNLHSEHVDLFLFDVLDINVTEQYMNYQSNIDVTPLLMDNEDDSLCVKLYSDVPLRWELIEGAQGSMGIIHEVLIDGIPNNDGLLNGYWSDGGIDSYIVVNGADGADGEAGEDGENGGNAVLVSTNGIGMWMNMNNVYVNQQSVEYRRYTYFDEPGMSVEAVNAHSASIRKKPLVDASDNIRRYEITVSAYLEGPFKNPAAGMRNGLNFPYELLPGQDLPEDASIVTPYSIAPWNYIGTECDTFANLQYPENVVDWVLVSFRTGLESETEVAKTMALLTQDGTIEFLNDCILTEENGDSFYIVVEHRNHIGVITPTPIPVVNHKLEHDFRIQNSFTNNGTRSGQKEIAPGVWAMYGGEGVQDANGNDINGNDKSQWVIENGTFLIYSPIDFNMDGTVDGQDKTIWFNNNGTSGALSR